MTQSDTLPPVVGEFFMNRIGFADTRASLEFSDGAVATLIAYRQDMKTVSLWSVGVEPESAHRKGYGTALMRSVLDRLREVGITMVHLRVDIDNVGAQAFYDSLGFVIDKDETRQNSWKCTLWL